MNEFTAVPPSPTQQGPLRDEMNSDGLSFGDVFRVIAKGKWLILVCVVICSAISMIDISITKPLFEASSTVRIDPNRSGSLGLTEALMGGSGDVIPTEIGILMSDQVALSAMESLNPEQFKNFAGFPRQQMVFHLEDADHKPLHLNSQQADLLDRFKKALSAKQQEGTQLVGLTFRDHNPDTAALLLNRLVDAYQRQSFDSRYNSVAQVRVWLSAQMDDLQKRAADAQQKLAQFQETNDLVGTDPTNNTIMDRLKLLNERLTLAEGDRIVKEAQLRAAVSGDPTVLTSLLPDTHLQALQTTEASLYAQEAQLATKFGPSYPPLFETRAQLTQVRAQINTSIGAITAHLNEDFDASKQAEAMLRQDYEGAVSHAYALNRRLADYAVLVAEGTSSRDLYDTLQFKLQQATVNAGLDSINTMVVDRARVEKFPVEPKKSLILASGLILGLATGLAIALLKDALGGQIQSISQIEGGLGLASLATVPHMNWAPRQDARVLDRPRLVTITEPRSRAAESYRTLRNSVLFSSIDRPPKLMLISSSLPGEGKSSTSANYAVVLAQGGAKVLIIDADLRRPTLHRIFGVENSKGLSDLLVDSTLHDLILQPIIELPNLYFLPAGQATTFPSEMLGSTKLHEQLEQWKKEYDNVLLDSAPLLTVSDSLPLATWADTTVLVARAGLTPLKALMRARAILVRSQARIAGVLLNDISHAGQDSGYYGKGGYGYYN